MFDVTALGELLIDFTFHSQSENHQCLFEQNPGGAPANLLVGLQRLGRSTAFIGKVGQDMQGDFLTAVLQAEQVDTSGLLADPNFYTTLAFVALNPGGERAFSFSRKPGADTQLTPEEIPANLIQQSRLFHVGSLSLTDEPARSATIEALRIANAAGCILSYDPNYRAPLWPSREEATHQMRRLLPYMDVLKISDEEAQLITGFSQPQEAGRQLIELGIPIAAITLGAKGTHVFTGEGDLLVPGFPTTAVDTTGAGDAFWAGFLCALLESNTPVPQITLAQAKEFASFGNGVAALCIQKRGGIPSMPTRKEVDAFLEITSSF